MCGGFRTDLGRIGKGMLSGEDSEFGPPCDRRRAPATLRTTAVTYHPVEEFRVRQEYFLQWWFNKGRSDVREFGNQPKDMRLIGVTLRLFRWLGHGIATMDDRGRAVTTLHLLSSKSGLRPGKSLSTIINHSTRREKRQIAGPTYRHPQRMACKLLFEFNFHRSCTIKRTAARIQ